MNTTKEITKSASDDDDDHVMMTYEVQVRVDMVALYSFITSIILNDCAQMSYRDHDLFCNFLL